MLEGTFWCAGTRFYLGRIIKEGMLQLDLARQFTYEKKRYCDHHGRGVILVMLAVVVVIGPLWLFCHCVHGGHCGDYCLHGKFHHFCCVVIITVFLVLVVIVVSWQLV